jgi:hypothetical protein
MRVPIEPDRDPVPKLYVSCRSETYADLSWGPTLVLNHTWRRLRPVNGLDQIGAFIGGRQRKLFSRSRISMVRR